MFEDVRTRRLLTALTTVTLATALLGAGIYLSSQPTLAADIAVSDASLSSNDGEPSSVTVTPDITVTWSGLDHDAEDVRILVFVSDDDSTWKDLAFKRTTSLTPAKTGSHRFQLTTFDVTSIDDYRSTETTPAFTTADFTAADGTTKDTTVYLRIRVIVNMVGSTSQVMQDYDRAFVVSVENLPQTAHGSGTVDTAVTD